MYTDIFNLFEFFLNWLLNPAVTNLLLLGLCFGVCYRFFKWVG